MPINITGLFQPSDGVHGFDLLDVQDLQGTLAVAQGGTGATTAAGARTNLSAAAATHTHALADVTDVTATAAEVNFTDGVTSAIQTQLDLKAPLASPTLTGTVTIPTPFTLGAVSVTPTGTELNYVDGVTSAIQTQLDGKSATGHAHAGTDITSGLIPAARMQEVLALADLSDVSGKSGTGSTVVLHTSPTLIGIVLSAGTASVAPINLNSGSLRTTPLAGAMEFLTDVLYFTISTGAARRTIALLESAQSWSGQPTFTAPILGTPASGVLTNCTGTAAGLTAGTVTTNANLTGPVTSTGNATAVADNTLAVAKLAATQTDVFFGRDTAAAGAGEEITVAAAKTLLNLAGSNTGDQTITLTGDVTGSGTGSFAATIGAAAVTPAKSSAPLKRKLLVAYDTIIAAPAVGDVIAVPIPDACTVTHIYAFSTGGTVTFKIEKRAAATPYTAGTAVVTAGNTTTADAQLKVTSFDSPGVAADQWLTINVTAVSGATKAKIAVWGTPD